MLPAAAVLTLGCCVAVVHGLLQRLLACWTGRGSYVCNRSNRVRCWADCSWLLPSRARAPETTEEACPPRAGLDLEACRVRAWAGTGFAWAAVALHARCAGSRRSRAVCARVAAPPRSPEACSRTENKTKNRAWLRIQITSSILDD